MQGVNLSTKIKWNDVIVWSRQFYMHFYILKSFRNGKNVRTKNSRRTWKRWIEKKKLGKSPLDYILKLYWKIYFSHWRMAWKFFEWLIINCIEKVSYWFGSVGGKINSFHGVFIAKIRKKYYTMHISKSAQLFCNLK